MSWEVEFTDEFGQWWEGLTEDEQDSIDVTVRLLEELGPHLPFPHCSDIKGSRHSQMRELRVQHKGEPYRILYAFDPRRAAILLIGERKQVMIAGIKRSSRLRINSMMSIWPN